MPFQELQPQSFFEHFTFFAMRNCWLHALGYQFRPQIGHTPVPLHPRPHPQEPPHQSFPVQVEVTSADNTQVGPMP